MYIFVLMWFSCQGDPYVRFYVLYCVSVLVHVPSCILQKEEQYRLFYVFSLPWIKSLDTSPVPPEEKVCMYNVFCGICPW